MIRITLHESVRSGESNSLPLGLTGVILILAALLVFVFPEILAWLIATILMTGGFALLAIAWKARNRGREFRGSRNDVWFP